ncbi:MAG TPA: T9SS type A sorting domain-containing protein [Flavipsychrobacter sp.]|nr:T9SS type A sorting domain-containing protein [Flavipsychrobacter sp.]
MNRIVLLFLSILLSSNLYAADTTRVLFIGNSFTAGENIPGLVKSFATVAGMPMEILAHTPGGISVGDVSQGTQAHMNNPLVFDLIRNNQLDFVVLQDNQGRFVLNSSFPNPTVSQVVAGHMKIRDSMRYYHGCARMLFFAGWALKNGWPDIGNGQKCIENIYENYLTLNTTANEIISPIGMAWLRSINQLANVDLWSADEAHQSAAGAYLTAATIFSSIYRLNTEKVSFSAQLDTAEARILRRIAYQTVMDSIQPTGLTNYIPSLTANGGTLTASTGYSSYEWYRNDTLVTTTGANTYTPAVQGCYQVVAKNNNGCKQRSAQQCLSQLTVIQHTETLVMKIAPNPASHSLFVETISDGTSVKDYKIISFTGQIVARGSFLSKDTSIPVSQLPEGLYILELSVNEKSTRTKFSKTN